MWRRQSGSGGCKFVRKGYSEAWTVGRKERKEEGSQPREKVGDGYLLFSGQSQII